MKFIRYLSSRPIKWLLLSFLILLPSIAAASQEEWTIKLSSPDFSHKGAMAAKFTCQGKDISPPLEWSHVPPATKSFVLIVDDPDAPDPAHPKMTWVHWVLYDIPSKVTHLSANIAPQERLPQIGIHGMTDFKKPGYGGPCPPVGVHRYFFKLYALDTLLNLPPLKTKNDIEKAMAGHILGKGELIGTYQQGG